MPQLQTTADFIQQHIEEHAWRQLRQRLMLREGKLAPKKPGIPKLNQQPKKTTQRSPRTRQQVWWKLRQQPASSLATNAITAET
jgi:hypothetical protein